MSTNQLLEALEPVLLQLFDEDTGEMWVETDAMIKGFYHPATARRFRNDLQKLWNVYAQQTGRTTGASKLARYAAGGGE